MLLLALLLHYAVAAGSLLLLAGSALPAAVVLALQQFPLSPLLTACLVLRLPLEVPHVPLQSLGSTGAVLTTALATKSLHSRCVLGTLYQTRHVGRRPP